MFLKVAIAGLILTLTLIVLHGVLFGRRAAAGQRVSGALGFWGGAAYLLLLPVAGVLAWTGLVSAALRGTPMTGLALILHMATAGAFAVLLGLLTLLWADGCRFFRSGGEATTERFSCLQKLFFWLLLASGFVSLLTVLVAMLPLAGTAGQRLLIMGHRWSGLVFVLTIMLHLYATWQARRLVR